MTLPAQVSAPRAFRASSVTAISALSEFADAPERPEVDSSLPARVSHYRRHRSASNAARPFRCVADPSEQFCTDCRGSAAQPPQLRKMSTQDVAST
jgi:hypothetical protein